MEQQFLKRYTELPFLIYMLRKKRLTLVSPASWDDKNDAHYMLTYQKKRNCGSVLALCFTFASETYHHWKVFAGSMSGVCIDFDLMEFKSWVEAKGGLQFREVDYEKLHETRSDQLATADLPFVKRHGYRDECERRLVFEAETEQLNVIDIEDFDLRLIRRVVLSPWLYKPVANEVKKTIRQIDGCQGMEITRTTLLNNPEWVRRAEDSV